MVTPYNPAPFRDNRGLSPAYTPCGVYASTSPAYGQAFRADNRQPTDQPTDPLVSWPKGIYARQFKRDTEVIHESLSPPDHAPGDLAAEVFGRQLRGEKLSTRHLASVLYERAGLYARHVGDIDHRLNKVQNELFRLQTIAPYDLDRDRLALERLLTQLESDRRQAELDFWKDTRDIRHELLERTQSYQASKHRADLLIGPGGEHGGF